MADAKITGKKCTGCGDTKPLNEFSKSRKGAFGLSSRCNWCRRFYSAQLREQHSYKEAHAARCKSWSQRDLARRRKESNWVPPGLRTTKVCRSCNEEKPLDQFHADKKAALGVSARCKVCAKAAARDWYAGNKDRAGKAAVQWRRRNPGKARGYSKAHWQRNKDNPAVRFTSAMRCAVGRSLGAGRSVGAFRHLSFSVEELRDHLERQFLPGMTWGNYGKWHVDHIIPLASFRIEDPGCEGFGRAWALTNLRPLWATDNMRKGKRNNFLL